MSCRRAEQVDLAEYLMDPAAEEWADFRQHFTRCADCAAAISRWTEVEAQLRDLEPSRSSHPDPDLLARFETEPVALTVAQRDSIAAHVDACPSCRTECRALRRFDFADVAAPAAEPTKQGRLWWERLSSFVSLPTPVPAVALVSLALLVVGGIALFSARSLKDPGDEPGALEVVEGPPLPPGPAQEVIEQEIAEVEPQPLPEALPIEPAPEPEPPIQDPTLADRGDPHPIPPPAPAPPASETPRLAPEPIAVIAALVELGPPDYLAPVGSEGQGWARFDSTVGMRSARPPGPRVQALVPPHVGLSLAAAPTLYWFLPEASERRVKFLLVDDRALEPVLELHLEPPLAAGVHAVRSADHGIELEPGVDYRWFVSVVVDPTRPASSLTSGGAVRRIEADPALREALETASPERLGHAYAEHGLWYDALASASKWIEADPDEPRLRAHRTALLEQVGLPPVDPE